MPEMERLENKEIIYLDIYQKIFIGLIATSFFMLIVFLYMRLAFDNAAIDNLIGASSGLHFSAWAWFIIRSVTFRMRLKEAMKEQEDI